MRDTGSRTSSALSWQVVPTALGCVLPKLIPIAKSALDRAVCRP